MKTILIDINNLTKEFDVLALAKQDIEDQWLKEKRIKEKLDLIGFVNELNMYNSVFMISDTDVIPFAYVKVPSEGRQYLFHCIVGEDKKDQYINNLLTILNKTDNGEFKLRQISSRELLESQKTHPDYPYFILQQQNYVIEDTN